MGRNLQALTAIEPPNLTALPACAAVRYPIQVRVSAEHRKMVETMVACARQIDRNASMTSVIEKAVESYARTQTITP